MKEQSIAVVTGFFSIGRESWSGFNKSDNLYLQYFKSWAKLKNALIVFVESDALKDEVLAFRSNLGLKDQTFVIVVKDIEMIAPELLNNIKKCTSNELSVAYRYSPSNPECIKAKYNYVMLLKSWCIQQAAEMNLKYTHYAWIDFGFNHGGEVYSPQSNFNFTWEYSFSDDKITLFNLQKLDEKRPIFDIVFSMDTYIMGSIIVVPIILSRKLWTLATQMMCALTYSGITDDDQVIWLMCSRVYPELFDIKQTSGWHKALYEYGGGEYLRLNITPKPSLIKKHLRKVKRFLDCIKYSKRIFKVSRKWIQM